MGNSLTERAEEVRRVEFRASENSDGQTLEGYAAVFNQWTDIPSTRGTFREQIAPGAFKRSLGQRTPVLQFDHGAHPLIGSLPLGTFSVIREDRNGLFVRARLSDNWLIQPVRDAIRDGAIGGMSFRFRVIDDGNWDGYEDRTIREVELYEAGPVVFPAYAQTSVSVRSLVSVLDDETRAALARELIPQGGIVKPGEPLLIGNGDPEAFILTRSTSTAAVELAQDDGPDEPPVASRNNTHTIQALLREAGLDFLNKETSDVPQ